MQYDDYFDEYGRELPDPNPVTRPVNFNRGSTLDEIRRNIGLASRLAEEEGLETFDEADDFEVGDDFEADHPFASRVDNMNREFEQLRNDIRAARERGEIVVDQATGHWSRNPDYKPPQPEGGMGVVDPHGDSDPPPQRQPHAKHSRQAGKPSSSRPDKQSDAQPGADDD